MALYSAMLPDDFISDLKNFGSHAEEMCEEMTKAGAEVALSNVRSSAPKPEIASHTKLSRPYKTPSDGGINTKVYISGYYPFSGNRKYFTRRGGGGGYYSTTKGVPISFVAIMYEYGRSGNPFPKKPFFRKSFKQAEIQKAMEDKQEEYIRKMLRAHGFNA